VITLKRKVEKLFCEKTKHLFGGIVGWLVFFRGVDCWWEGTPSRLPSLWPLEVLVAVGGAKPRVHNSNIMDPCAKQGKAHDIMTSARGTCRLSSNEHGK
jgi:hypothetical protein